MALSRVQIVTQTDVLIYALLDAANDKDSNVNNAITNALQKLGQKKPELMLDICYQYLKKHLKLTQEHRTVVLSALADVCKNDLQSIDCVIIKDVIDLCVEELISCKEVIPSWQGAACAVLVALSRLFCFEVMGCLHAKFQPGILPHYFVVQALGDLAIANPFGMVPFMKAILQSMLTMLGIVKHDNMKWVFSCVLAQFSEAILEYISNIEQAPDTSVKKEAFSTELSVAFSTLSHSWLYSKDVKLKTMVVEAISNISPLLSKKTLDGELPRLIPVILSLYKRHQEPSVITKSLTKILDAALKNNCPSVGLHFSNILSCLFPQISAIPDYSQPLQVKNHNEILRCFTVIASHQSACIVSFVLERLDSNNESVKIGCLTVLRHLINSSEAFISDQIATILDGLNDFINETSIKVKKVFAHVIVALAHHGFLELDRTHAMIKFIAQQCALPVEEKFTDNDNKENDDLRTMCENILHLLTTTVDKMSTILWPHILKFLILENLTQAVGVLCKSAAYLSRKLKSDVDLGSEVDFELHWTLPRPMQLMSRFFVLLARPNVDNNRGIHILSLMSALIGSLEKKLVYSWDVEIPKLIVILKDTSIPFPQEEWEKLILELLSKSIQEVDSEEWTVDLGKTFIEQLDLHSQNCDEKNFSFRCIGIVLMKISSKHVVNDFIDAISKHVNHSHSSDSKGFAAALGYCAKRHMDSVLVKLDDLERGETAKKSKLFSFIKDIKGETEYDNWKATIILSYGYVAMGAHPLLLKARIESPIIRNITPHFNSSKEVATRLSLIQTTEMIAKSLYQIHLKEKFSFQSKNELLKHMLNFISAEKGVPMTSSSCSLAINACTSLLKLDPYHSRQDQLLLLHTCYDCVITMPEIVNNCQLEYSKDLIGYHSTAISSLECLLQELFLQDVSPNNLYHLFVSLEPYIRSSLCRERERAMHAIWIILKTFLDNLPAILPGSSSFESHGAMLARLVPRSTDPSVVVRGLALDGILIILKTISKYNGIYSEDTDIQMFRVFKEKVEQGDPKSLFTATSELAKALSTKLDASHLREFLDVLMEGLLDSEGSSSSGTCVVLNNVLKCKGASLHQEMDTLIQLLYGKLCEITCMQTRKGTLLSIKTLAKFQMSSVLNNLLSYPIPYDRHISDWWKALAADSSLCSNIIEQFCEVLLCIAPYNEHPDPRNKNDSVRIATSKSLAIVGAFREMFSEPNAEKSSKQLFEKIFACLLTILMCYIDVHPPNVFKDNAKTPDGIRTIVLRGNERFLPCSLAMDTFKTFLLCIKYNAIIADVGDFIGRLDNLENNLEAMAVIVMSLAKHYQHHLPGLVSLFNMKLSSAYDSERVVSVAFFAELIKHHAVLNQMALEIILNSLLGRLVDSSRVVRRLAIKGLSAIEKLDAEHLDSLEWFGVYKYSNTVLSAMISGLDDKDDPDNQIALEAMKGLIRLLEDLDESHVQNALINIALRVQPYFEKDNSKMREVAFSLFGKLSRFAKGSAQNAFLEQLHNNLVCLLLHLNDENSTVVKVCKEALRSLAPSLQSNMANDMLQMHLIDDCQLRFRDFIATFSKILATNPNNRAPFYVAKCVTFFKSPWPSIRGNAALFAGYLLLNTPMDPQTISADQTLLGAFTMLLKDSSPRVKVAAADAISLLYNL